MGQRHHHYERAFEAMARKLRVPCVSVNEAKRALVPGKDSYRFSDAQHGTESRSLKNFDFVLYGLGSNLLIDVKGRRLAPAAKSARVGRAARSRSPRLESWVNAEDVRSMLAWQTLFGPDFEAAFVFYYSSAQPPAGDLFDEIFGFEGVWYAPRIVAVSDYARAMKTRSKRWGTVDLSREAFEAHAGPLLSAGGDVRRLEAAPCSPAPWLEPLAGVAV